jgi:CRISPR/Cas system-associated exonuclease Cas4 (RecB family)
LATDAAGWEAIHSEYAFGLAHDEGRDPHSTAWPAKILDGYSLRGSVDWIERHVQSGALRITDFKTGRSPKEYPAHVGGGAYLQPLLYALAVEYHLKQEVKFSRLYYCTQRGNYEVVPMTPSERAKVDVRHALAIIDEAIEKGSLLAAPAAKQCEYCDYRVVCGPREEERTRRKAAVPGLVALRSLP